MRAIAVGPAKRSRLALKPLQFALAGALGCGLGALLAELLTEKPHPGPLSFWLLAAAVGLWAGIVTAGLTLALIAKQNRYLRRRFLTAGQVLKGLAGGLAAGMVAGAIAQVLYASSAPGAHPSITARIVAWAVFGGLAGLGMTFFVPNLKRSRSLIGGTIGGALGGVGFLWAAGTIGDFAGRLTGSVSLGLFIGLMVAVAEIASRDLWLEITYGPNEVSTINLGPTPVIIGSDAGRCTAYVPGAVPVAFHYLVAQGRILCQDVVSGKTTELRPGDTRAIGGVTLEVCGAG